MAPLNTFLSFTMRKLATREDSASFITRESNTQPKLGLNAMDQPWMAKGSESITQLPSVLTHQLQVSSNKDCFVKIALKISSIFKGIYMGSRSPREHRQPSRSFSPQPSSRHRRNNSYSRSRSRSRSRKSYR